MGFFDFLRKKKPADPVRGKPGGRFRYESDGVTKYQVD